MSKKIKVGVLGLRGIPRVLGGIETHCENLYPRLARKGLEIVLFSRKPYVDPGRRAYRGVRLRGLPCLKNKYLETYFHTLLGVLAARLERVDLLHLHAVGPGLFVPLARLLGMKVVFTHHGFDYQRKKWSLPARWILKAGEFLACTFAHSVIAVADYLGKHLEEEYRRPVHCLPNGVVMPSGRASESGLLGKYGLEANRYILALGRFVPEKGFHDLIQAYEKFQAFGERTQSVKLVIAGRADHQDQYSRMLRERAGKNVVFTGFIFGASLRAVFRQARLFVIPSYHEGLPLVLLEALSFGVPALASDIPAHREIPLEPERYFRPGDIDALAKKMREFVFQTNNVRKKKQRIAMVKKRYNWENNAKQTYAIYQDTLNSNHGLPSESGTHSF